MSSEPIIRPVDPLEAEVLTTLAMRSKAYWGYSVEFMEACRDELTVRGEDITNSKTEYFICEVDNTIVGYFAIEPCATNEYELEALFVEPQHIGQGYGRMLINSAKVMARERGAKSLLIQVDPNAERFYLAAGAASAGERESGSVPGRFLPLFRIPLVSADDA